MMNELTEFGILGKCFATVILATTFCAFVPMTKGPNKNTLIIDKNEILCNGYPVKLIGLRSSNALISDKATADLIKSLDQYKPSGLNTISVFIMGSRFGDIKGYFPDGL